MTKIGIKIYKGSNSNVQNVKKSLASSVEFRNIHLFRDSEVRQKIEEMLSLCEPIYCWAGLSELEKKLDKGNKILFVIESQLEAYLLEFIDKVYDAEEEIANYIGWNNTGWKHVVFMKNSKRIILDDAQLKEIFRITDAYESTSRFANYIHNQLLSGPDAEELITKLNLKND